MADADLIAKASTSVEHASVAYELAFELASLLDGLVDLEGSTGALVFALGKMADRASSAADIAHMSALRLQALIGGDLPEASGGMGAVAPMVTEVSPGQSDPSRT